jgi:hypothetical protein
MEAGIFQLRSLLPANIMQEQPILSKKAERRVKDHLPIPTVCPHCRGAVAFVNNSAVYGREFGAWPWMYLCQAQPCRAYVGTHPETNLPLGTLATAEIRTARKDAKDQFNRLLQSGSMSRTEAYSWLAAKMNIPTAACHFGWFDVAQCKEAARVLALEKLPHVRTPVATKAFADLRTLLGAGRGTR